MPHHIRDLLATALVLMAGAGAADAKSVGLTGKMGFLGEWEISGQLVQNERGEFSGPLVMTHTGLCTHDGPLQKQAEIRLSTASRVNATISMDGADCAFSATSAKAPEGVLTCPNTSPIPLVINLQK
jgi:hypothetical protein